MRKLLVAIGCLPFMGFTQTVNAVDFKSPKLNFANYVEQDIKPLEKEIEIKGFQYYDVQKILGLYPKPEGRKFENRIICPNAFLQQCDSSVLYGVVNTGEVSSLDYSRSTSNFGKPFYYKTTEVTNAEYREFLNYVRDSTVLQELSKIYPEKFKIKNKAGNEVLNWKVGFSKLRKIKQYSGLIDSLVYEIDSAKFYKGRKIKMAVYQYEYVKNNGETINLNLYPDTLSWIHNVKYSWAEPMTQMYFWHPVYGNYPVVGVTYNQAMAYLHWLKQKGIPVLDKKGIKYSIGLPRPEEGEFAVTVEGYKAFIMTSKKEKEFMARSYYDRSIDFDLILKNPSILNTHRNVADSLTEYEVLVRKNSLKNKLRDPFDNFNENWTDDGGIFTLESNYANPNFNHLHSINNNLFHMGSNVSEWQDVRFSAYDGFAQIQAFTLQNSRYQDVRTAGKEYEDLYSKFDSTDQLVSGGNWMDESYDVHLGVPLRSIYKKTFANPDSSYSTVGFRYVVRLLPEENAPRDVVVREVFNPVNIFEVLKKEGFELQNDTSEKMVMDYDKLIFKLKESSVDTVGVHSVFDSKLNYGRTQAVLKKNYQSILEALLVPDGRVTSFYSYLPGQSTHVLALYELECLEKSTIVLYLK